MTTQLLSSGEFCKLPYDTIPVRNTPANVWLGWGGIRVTG
jgi:hypothetical protein